MRWRRYDGRYGRPLGIVDLGAAGLAFQMSDGSRHFIGDKRRLVMFFVRATFWVYVFVRGSF